MGLQAGTNGRVILIASFILICIGTSVTVNSLTFLHTNSNDNLRVDEDTPINSVIGSLSLQGGPDLKIVSKTTSYVTVSLNTTLNDSVTYNILLNIHLDYENNDASTLICVFEGSDSSKVLIQYPLPIYAKDVNEAPVLQNKPYLLTVSENTSINTIVDNMITAVDEDSNDHLTYKLIPSSQNKNGTDFSVEPVNGSLILEHKLDFEKIPFYQFSVVVTDHAGLNDSADVFITILDVQDTPPYFTGEPFLATIMENDTTSKSVITVNAADGDRGIPNDILFNITSETCKGLFKINSQTGLITPKKTLNPETCVLEIMATENNRHPQAPNSIFTSTTSVTITIQDINNNAPEFSSTSYSVSVEENTQPGVMINLNTHISIKDKDQGNNALFDVNVITYEDYFEVTPSKIQSSGEIWIRVKNSSILDYEIRDTLTIEIEANDTSEDSHRTTATVTISITNTNDNSPFFSNSTYKGQLFENSTAGASVLKIYAQDDDKSDDHKNYGIVKYNFEGSQSDFAVNSSTGEITLDHAVLNREIKDMYYLTVFAEDGGGSKASVPVEVRILDSNDETPTFVTNYYQTSLLENSLILVPPITVLATDNDEKGNRNSEIVYSIYSTLPPDLESHFHVSSTTGLLSVISSLDYENVTFEQGIEGKITLLVVASDMGIPKLQSNVSVVVILQDVNDNNPACDMELFTKQLPENIEKSTPVFKVNATDKDGSSLNNIIMYSIDSDSLGKFIINSSTGLLSLRDTLDRDQKSSYNIIVTVADNGASPLSGSCTVSVELMDINNKPPNFSKKGYTKDFPENTIGILTETNATDPDQDHKLVYTIDWQQCRVTNPSGQNVNTSVLSNLIYINSSTGQIDLQQPLDRETISEFVLHLVVNDTNAVENAPQIDIATLTVTILDLNDQPPMFTSHSYNASIRENMPNKSDVKFDNPQTLEIYDADAMGENSTFKVLLLTYNTTFEINPGFGTSKATFTISVLNSSALDYETTQNFTLEVLTIDTKNSSLSDSATVLVTIINENDNTPEFIDGPYTSFVSENSTNDTHIITVNATDKDLGSYGELAYSLDDSTKTFYINNMTGEIYLYNSSLDRETMPEYSVTVKATDKGNFRATTQLTITVTDVNDNPPEFNKDTIKIHIDDGGSTITPILIVQATDKDQPNTMNSKITYSLLNSSSFPESCFYVDPSSGMFSINNSVDYEKLDPALNGTFSLTVVATDLGTPQMSAYKTIQVVVRDINDNAPKFYPLNYTVAVPEDASQGSFLISVHASDNDSTPANNEVSYVLDTFSDKIFSINKSTGQITVNSKLDREQIPSYTVIVTALDNGQPAMTSTTLVYVDVTDINDSPPTFSWHSRAIDVTENIEDMLEQNQAKDPDLNPDLQYSILWSESTGMDGNGRYISGDSLKNFVWINESNCEIKPVDKIDREKIQRFQLTLVVVDKNNIPGYNNNDTAILTVVVKDVDDNDPTFNEQAFSAEIQENMPHGTEIKMKNIAALIISDPDAPGNNRYNITLEDNSAFSITPSFGDGNTTCVITVTNSSVLDYEQRQMIRIKVVATANNMKNNSTATVNVYILNSNDNSPEFNQSSLEVYVSEDSMPGASIIDMKATDNDLGEFGIFYYSIYGIQTGFIIDNTTGELTLNTTLDREHKDSYFITVKARDTGGLEGSIQLTIKVKDVNDEHPKFTHSSYEVVFKENNVNPEVPLFVKATDDDDPSTDNSKLYYNITNIPQKLPQNLVQVSNDGEVTFTSSLDFEDLINYFPDGRFQVEVTAVDLGSPPLNSSALINVTILDVNDLKPNFTSTSYYGSVTENSSQGVSIMKVSATDEDGTSPNNELYYVFKSGSKDRLMINSTTGVISVGIGTTLDRETIDLYGFELIVLAIDRGSPSLTSSTTVSIQVLDINDTPPEFNSTNNALYSVYENATKGTEIATITAVDKDEYPILKYSLNWSNSLALDEKERRINISLIQEWLDINNVTGEITVKSELDRELVEQIVLKVVVADANYSTTPQVATATVTVSILDVNDNPPIVTGKEGQLNLNVSEGTKLGTEVSILTATDADKDQNITFTLNNTIKFKITAAGRLTLAAPLDREKEPQLTFYVFATDSGSPSMMSNITVIIDVLDINDNDPDFYINQNQTTFSVQENANNNEYFNHSSNFTTCIVRMNATDKDEGANGNVTFYLKGDYPFIIDPITGVITVHDKIDREEMESYTITIVAADNPELETPRRTLQTITINIEDVNDNPPIFSSNNGYQGTIPETASLGTVVTITPSPVFATDKDAGSNSHITYSLTQPSNSYFIIDPSSGDVNVSQNITDKIGTYSFKVEATDNGIPPLHAETSLTITITDVNNHAPEFVKIGPIPAIPECASNDQLVYTFSATDADQDLKNKKITYSFYNVANNDSAFFSLDPDSGKLYIGPNKNNGHAFGIRDELKIIIQAKDSGEPATPVTLSDPIQIIIIDTNNNVPQFSPDINTNFTVKEGENNKKIGNVLATDDDRDSNLTYQLTDVPWANHFSIMSDPSEGGVIYLMKPLDREEIAQIILKVNVNDNCRSSEKTFKMCDTYALNCDIHTAEVTINVIIEDINDNPPVFLEKRLLVGFLASTNYGEIIINLLSHVKDNDTAPYSVHNFYQLGEIQPDSDISKTWNRGLQEYPIKVDVNGTIRTNYKFNENALGYFVLQVLANDSAGNDTTNLKIYIVGESQVIHMTLMYSEEEARQLQNSLVQDLSDPDHHFVADNILPSYDNDGHVNNLMSVLVVHAIDRDENIIDGKALLNFIDVSPRTAKIKNKYKIYSTESGVEADKKAAENETNNRYLYILIGIIAVVAITFVITLYLLIHTIRRFKRKLKAATLEVNVMKPMKQDTFPGLDNDNIKANNPIFMRDDLNLDENNFNDNYDYSNKDTLSQTSENSLDLNEINSGRENIKSGVDEQEMTIDVFEGDDTEPGRSNLIQNLHFRRAQFLGNDDRSPNMENNQSVDLDDDGDLNLNMSYRNFDSTEI